MGSGNWSNDAYKDISNVRSKQTTSQNFTQQTKRAAHADLSPVGVDIRESRDSAEHPNSLAIAIWVDETGSMGKIPETMIKTKLGALMSTIIDNGIPDPQILFGGVGDHYSDQYPLQVSQFESSTTAIDDQLSKIYLEGNGGGNGGESYGLAWLFCARHTSIDCFEKRGEKGFLFTIGDECFHPAMEKDILERKIGYKGGEDVDVKSLYDEVTRQYHVFHIHANQANHHDDPKVFSQWKALIGERFLVMDNQDNIAELIATTIAVVHGVDIDTAMANFDPSTRNSVSTALATVKDSLAKTRTAQAGVVAI